MRLVIQEGYYEIAKFTAEYIAEAVSSFVPSAKKPLFVLAIPSGNTALGVYQNLTRLYKEGKVSFEHCATFNLDEFVGLPAVDSRSQSSYMWREFYANVNIKRENCFHLDGTAADLVEECARYEEAIAARGGIDLTFFSTGDGGHVARNEPGSSLKSLTRAKTLASDTAEQIASRWCVKRSEVPELTLTVGVGTLMAAREVVVLFSGSKRARALEAALEKGINHMYPVSAFQRHKKVLFVCDDDATMELKVKTVDYFVGLEKTSKEFWGEAAAAGADGEAKRQRVK